MTVSAGCELAVTNSCCGECDCEESSRGRSVVAFVHLKVFTVNNAAKGAKTVAIKPPCLVSEDLGKDWSIGSFLRLFFKYRMKSGVPTVATTPGTPTPTARPIVVALSSSLLLLDAMDGATESVGDTVAVTAVVRDGVGDTKTVLIQV